MKPRRPWKDVPITEGILEMAGALAALSVAAVAILSGLVTARAEPLRGTDRLLAIPLLMSLIATPINIWAAGDMFVQYLEQRELVHKADTSPKGILRFMKFFLVNPYSRLVMGFVLLLWGVVIWAMVNLLAMLGP